MNDDNQDKKAVNEDLEEKDNVTDITEDVKDDSHKGKKRKKIITKELEETISKLQEENTNIKNENAQIKDTLLRQMAEFDNYKKRTQREFSEIIVNANAHLIKDILQVIDELELSLKSTEENKEFDSFYEGIKLIYNKFLDILKEKGLKSIEAVGKEFNTDQHDAVMQMEKEGTPSNLVLEEYQKGYTFNERIIRHSKVVVSK